MNASATPVERFISKLHSATGETAQRNGAGWTARCPAHGDRHPSLSVSEGVDGRVLVRCHAGCSTEAICGAVGLKLADLMPPRTQSSNRKPTASPVIVATCDYRDERDAADCPRCNKQEVRQ